MASNIFFSTLSIRLGFPHPMVHDLFLCICGQSINVIGIHLFHCAHGVNTTTHDAVQDFLFYIVRDVEFHILCKQTHVSQCHFSGHHNDEWILCL